MNKKFRKTAGVCLAALLISTSFISAFAYQENELDIPHEHEYSITAVNAGEVTFACDICDADYTEVFSSHINEREYAPLDVVEDGIVNAKDYAYLIKNY